MEIKKFEFNPFPVNCYLLYDKTNEAILIDPGIYNKNEEEEFDQYIDSHHLSIKYVLNTHLHFDHCFGLAYIYKKYGLLTHAAVEDEFLLNEMSNQASRFGLKLRGEIPPIGAYIKEGDIISAGEIKLHALQVPGHSPGSIIYYCKEINCIFSGDVLFRGSIGRSDLQKGNQEDLINGIRTKLLTLSEKTIVYPGHGPQTTIGDEKLLNIYLA